MEEKIIYHIDVNSAFLSWSAAYRVNVLGETFDLRTVPSVVSGDKESRHSIILAKSIPAKKYGIQTGEPLIQAQKKYPDLVVVDADYSIYVEASRKLISMIKKVIPQVEQFSIDECWADASHLNHLYGSPVLFANDLKDRIWKELGFTVNIGISSNKLLAKMASDLKKPNKVHTLFPQEIKSKMWPLPVGDLFYVGHATKKKLYALGILTIGQLANADLFILKAHLKKHGELIWNFANGRFLDEVSPIPPDNKGYGNSLTVAFDVADRKTAYQVLLSLCETVGMRMRKDKKMGSCITIHIRDYDFFEFSHQAQLISPTNVTSEIYHWACKTFDHAWNSKTPIRQLGIHMSKITEIGYRQYNLFDGDWYERMATVDQTVDAIRARFGEDAILRASFLESGLNHMAGGLGKDRRTGVTKPV